MDLRLPGNLIIEPLECLLLNDGSSFYVPGPDKRIDQVEEMTKEFTELKDEVEALRYQLRELSDEFKVFRKQFE